MVQELGWKKKKSRPEVVVNAWNPSYPGGRGRRTVVQSKTHDPICKTNQKSKGWGIPQVLAQQQKQPDFNPYTAKR
jgi:hypothetical protein